MRKKDYMFSAVVTRFADNDYNIRFPDIEEIHTFGENLLEAYDMAEDALKLYLYDLYADGEEIPEATTFFRQVEENQALIVIRADLDKIILEYGDEVVKPA
ncbi:MAG: type II toxin-antitoxin system HicB family antitoxin [Defluviitaleaceae bacterium]|nr:type II toxin-antitoxin system HicB family antitoxin [Defluviitaleaceae bacterium]